MSTKEEEIYPHDTILTNEQLLTMAQFAIEKKQDPQAFVNCFSAGIHKGLERLEKHPSLTHEAILDAMAQCLKRGEADKFIDYMNHNNIDVNSECHGETFIDMLIDLDGKASGEVADGHIKITQFLLQKGGDLHHCTYDFHGRAEASPYERCLWAYNCTTQNEPKGKSFFSFSSPVRVGHILPLIKRYIDKHPELVSQYGKIQSQYREYQDGDCRIM